MVKLHSCESAAGFVGRLLWKLATPLSWACAPPQRSDEFSFIILGERNNIWEGGQDVQVSKMGSVHVVLTFTLPGGRSIWFVHLRIKPCEIAIGNDLFETSLVTYNGSDRESRE